MPSETDKDLLQIKTEGFNQTPKNRDIFERYKHSILGVFIGSSIGTIFSFTVPKDLIRKNSFLNSWIQPDKMASNLYPACNAGFFGWVGGFIGATIDLFKPDRQENAQASQNIPDNFINIPVNQTVDIPQEVRTTMQDKLASKRQEVTCEKTR